MTPIDALYLLLIVVPVGLVFARFCLPGVSWPHIWLLTPAASWLIVNLALWLDPPDNGAAYVVSTFLGWIWSLPVLLVLWVSQALLICLAPRLPAMRSTQRAAKAGLYATSTLALVFLIYGLFGWIGSDRAIAVAMRFVSRMGPPSQSAPHATWSWFQWHVRFEDGSFVDVSRNGRLLGGGGRR